MNVTQVSIHVSPYQYQIGTFEINAGRGVLKRKDRTEQWFLSAKRRQNREFLVKVSENNSLPTLLRGLHSS